MLGAAALGVTAITGAGWAAGSAAGASVASAAGASVPRPSFSKCLFLNPSLGHVGGTRPLCVVADQYRDVDGLAEVVLRADGGPELVGEEWPLVWWGQLVGRDR